MVNKAYSVLVNAVVMREGKILLIQRSDKEKHQAGKWCVPGGKLEFQEITHKALEKTAIKEVFEETGVLIGDKLTLIDNNTFKHLEDGLPVIAIVFFCRYRSGTARPLEDTQALKWVSEQEIDKFEFPPNVKSYIKKGFEYEKQRAS